MSQKSTGTRKSLRMLQKKASRPKALPPPPRDLSTDEPDSIAIVGTPRPASRTPEQPSAPRGITTRPGNKTKCVGKPDMTAPRRPPGAAQAEQEAKKAQKLAEEARKDTARDDVAAFENRSAQRRLEAQKTKNNPPIVNLGPRKSFMSRPTSSQGSPSRSNSAAPVDTNAKAHNDSEVASRGKGEEGDDEDETGDMEVDEEDEEDMSLAEKKGGRGEKKMSARDDILARRANIVAAEHMALSSQGQRRERSESLAKAAESPVLKKTKKGAAIGGLKENWAEEAGDIDLERSNTAKAGVPRPDEDENDAAEATAFGGFADEGDEAEGQGIKDIVRSNVDLRLTWGVKSRQSAGSRKPTLPSEVRPSAAEDSSPNAAESPQDFATAVQEAEDASDREEAAELFIPEVVRTQIRLKTQASSSGPRGVKHAVNGPASRPSKGEVTSRPNRSAGAKRQRQRYKTGDIPEDMRAKWNDVLLPAAKGIMGLRSDPWGTLTADEVQELMDKSWPKYREQYTVEDDDVFCQMVNQRLREWRGGFSSSAMEVVDIWIQDSVKQAWRDEDESRRLLDPPPSFVAEEVLYQLGREPKKQYNEDEEYKKNKPFFWDVWEDGGDTREGPFQSEFITFTFYWHLRSVRDGRVPAKLTLSEEEGANRAFPIGALILSILAVERALKMWITGVKVVPHRSNPAGWFSSDNWGDYYRHTPTGDVKMKRSTTFVNAIKSLKVKDWYMIMKGAWEIRDTLDRHPRGRSKHLGIPGMDEEDEDGPQSDIDGDLSLLD